jgi:hypothetical protein
MLVKPSTVTPPLPFQKFGMLPIVLAIGQLKKQQTRQDFSSMCKKNLKLPTTFPAVAIFDVFAAHHCQSFLYTLAFNNIRAVFIPAGCTAELQPLDLTLNLQVSWYAKQVCNALGSGKDIESVKVNLAICGQASTCQVAH